MLICVLDCVLSQAAGSTLPGTGMQIDEAKVRGVNSSGMLCSAFDLGWVAEADGVLVELPEHASIGKPCPSTAMKVLSSLCEFCIHLQRPTGDQRII